MSTKLWLPASIALLLLGLGACTSNVVAGSGDPQGGDPQGNDPACPSAEPTGPDNMVACAQNNLDCNYTSGPCTVEYLCTEDAWHHLSAVCMPAAVPWESAQTGDACAFIGEAHIEQGNCTDTWNCESDHTWSVMFGVGPDGYPCP